MRERSHARATSGDHRVETHRVDTYPSLENVVPSAIDRPFTRTLVCPPYLGPPMTTSLQTNYRTRRVYEVRPSDGGRELRLSDRVVELGEREFGSYQSVTQWLPSVRGVADLSRELGVDEAKVPRLFETLEKSGLLYRVDGGSKTMSG